MITPKQIKYLRYLVYNYNVNISEENVRTSKDASSTFTKIETAIKQGKVKKRTSRPTNCKVKVIKGVWRLIEDKPDLNDTEQYINGFAKFIEQENERQHEKFMIQHEQWLKRQAK